MKWKAISWILPSGSLAETWQRTMGPIQQRRFQTSYLTLLKISSSYSCKSEGACSFISHVHNLHNAIWPSQSRQNDACSTKVRLGVGQRPSSRSDFSFFLFFFGVSASVALASKHQVEKVAWQRRDLRLGGHTKSLDLLTEIRIIVLPAKQSRKR